MAVGLAGRNQASSAASASAQQAWQYKSPHNQKHATRIILECLRELGTNFLPLPEFTRLGVIDLVTAVVKHPNPIVAKLASETSER